MKKREQSSGYVRSVVLAFVLGGATAFALLNHPAPSRAAESVEPAVSVRTPIAAEPGARPVSAAADRDVCDVQLD